MDKDEMKWDQDEEDQDEEDQDGIGYWYDESSPTNIGYAYWMRWLPGATKISELSIPGTHRSTARGKEGTRIDDYITTQRMPIYTQLIAGIRYLDIRAGCRLAPYGTPFHTYFAMHNGPYNQILESNNLLGYIARFLKSHPHETILMRLKEEYDPESGSQSFEDAFKRYKEVYGDLFWTYTSSNPTLEEVRGKIVLLQDFPASQTYGIPYSSLNTQDQYQVCGSSTPDAMYGKWTAVKDHLKRANGNKTQIHLNYLSGTGGDPVDMKKEGTYPWFIASGCLVQDGSTGTKMIQEDRTDKWPDFPRRDNGKVFYGGMNGLTTVFIPKLNLSHVGIVAADFPGEDLINNVINLNKRLLKKDS